MKKLYRFIEQAQAAEHAFHEMARLSTEPMDEFRKNFMTWATRTSYSSIEAAHIAGAYYRYYGFWPWEESGE